MALPFDCVIALALLGLLLVVLGAGRGNMRNAPDQPSRKHNEVARED